MHKVGFDIGVVGKGVQKKFSRILSFKSAQFGFAGNKKQRTCYSREYLSGSPASGWQNWYSMPHT